MNDIQATPTGRRSYHGRVFLSINCYLHIYIHLRVSI